MVKNTVKPNVIRHISILNDCGGGVARCIKAGYYKMGSMNFLFTKQEGFKATALLIEYEF